MNTNLEAILALATRYARAGQNQSARQLLWQLIARIPDDKRAWLLLAYVAPNLEEKRAALWKALSLDPSSAKVSQAFLQLLDVKYIRQAAQAGVFISYAHADEVFAAQLDDDLRFFGIPVWIDIFDISEASDWYEAIEAAAQRCGVMLLVSSPAALRADNVHNELQRFMEAGKIVVPVQHQPCDLSSFNLWQIPVDFTEDYSSGLQDLMRLLAAPEPAKTGTYRTI